MTDSELLKAIGYTWVGFQEVHPYIAKIFREAGVNLPKYLDQASVVANAEFIKHKET